MGARASLLTLPRVADHRGTLTFGEAGAHLPFVPQRVFVIRDVPPGVTRGGHAHHRVHEVLVAAAGRLTVTVDDGTTPVSYTLDRPATALYLPPLLWRWESDFSADAVLVVMASTRFDPDDYITDRDEYLRLVRAR